MRKKTTRGTSSRNTITKPTANRSLQIARETIRTLSSDELSQAATGAAALICPWDTDQTQQTKDTMPSGGQKR